MGNESFTQTLLTVRFMVRVEVVAEGTPREWTAYYPDTGIFFFRKRELAEEFERLITIMKILKTEIEQIPKVQKLRAKWKIVDDEFRRLMKRTLET